MGLFGLGLIQRGLSQLSSITWLLVDMVTEVCDNLARGRAPFRRRLLFEQTARTGVGSVPLVAMVSFFLGLTMALLHRLRAAHLRHGTSRA